MNSNFATATGYKPAEGRGGYQVFTATLRKSDHPQLWVGEYEPVGIALKEYFTAHHRISPSVVGGNVSYELYPPKGIRGLPDSADNFPLVVSLQVYGGAVGAIGPAYGSCQIGVRIDKEMTQDGNLDDLVHVILVEKNPNLWETLLFGRHAILPKDFGRLGNIVVEHILSLKP